MAKISKIYKLPASQATLDFIDIDVSKDIPLFIDPHFLAHKQDMWSQISLGYVKSFFQYFLALIKAGNLSAAKEIFSQLVEPNETRLGLSKGKPSGRSINRSDIDKLFRSLTSSKAVLSGLAEDLEDTLIFVKGIGKDKLSDITTMLIREKLIEYTQTQCDNWGIPLTDNVPSGFYWSAKAKKWETRNTRMLIINGEKILLVPKGIVSFSENYTPQYYHQHFVLNFLKNEQLRLKTALVQYRTNKKKRTKTAYVSKTDLKKKISPGHKLDLNNFTMQHPEVFKDFKAKTSLPSKSLTHNELGVRALDNVCDYLIDRLVKLPTGKDDSRDYELLILSILELLLYPDLICPLMQVEIHDGRKRIDITFDNAATSGIFHLLHGVHKIPCPYIMAECKNYTKDPKNPEFDQLAGRFSPNRGQVGLLIFRDTSNLDLIIQRCNDTFKDQRGLIIPLCDKDLIKALNERKSGNIILQKTIQDRVRTIRTN